MCQEDGAGCYDLAAPDQRDTFFLNFRRNDRFQLKMISRTMALTSTFSQMYLDKCLETCPSKCSVLHVAPVRAVRSMPCYHVTELAAR